MGRRRGVGVVAMKWWRRWGDLFFAGVFGLRSRTRHCGRLVLMLRRAQSILVLGAFPALTSPDVESSNL